MSTLPEAIMPVIYIPHGGGPLPLLGDPHHHELIHFLRRLPDQLPTPKTIVVVSAHWESDVATVSSSNEPRMIYDYGGFPAETYTYQYRAPGNPELAHTIAHLLATEGIAYKLDSHRGYDHGTFVPLMLMYPKADIPVVQVSLLRSLDPDKHTELGQALAPLRKQGVLIVGSGMSSHNASGSLAGSLDFDNWLSTTLCKSPIEEALHNLKNWRWAPGARESHRREEHLLPLHVCLGAASLHSSSAQKIFAASLFDRPIAGFLWAA